MDHVDTCDSAYRTDADATQQPAHRIEVEVARYGAKGPVYRVTYAGKVLIKGCRCPLFESCRALLARGITGRLELWRPGRETFDTACDIQVAAQYTIIETETASLRLERWHPFPRSAVPGAGSRSSIEARTATDGSRVPLAYPRPNADFRRAACQMTRHVTTMLGMAVALGAVHACCKADPSNKATTCDETSARMDFAPSDFEMICQMISENLER